MSFKLLRNSFAHIYVYLKMQRQMTNGYMINMVFFQCVYSYIYGIHFFLLVISAAVPVLGRLGLIGNN